MMQNSCHPATWERRRKAATLVLLSGRIRFDVSIGNFIRGQTFSDFRDIMGTRGQRTFRVQNKEYERIERKMDESEIKV